MAVVVAGIGDAGAQDAPFFRDQGSQLQIVRSFEFDQFAVMQFGKRFPYVGGKHLRLDIVFFGQYPDDFGHGSSIAPANDSLSSLV
jgi:hypothetical protein